MPHRNHPSRRELYAHGFKEGDAWRDDRRELEAALWEIDQLERQTEYEYQRPSPSHPQAWTSGLSSVWRPSHSSGGLFNARYQNAALYPSSESRMSSLPGQHHTRYNDDSTSFDGYSRGYAHRTYPSSHAVPYAFRGYPESQSPRISRDYRSPYFASPSYQDFRDPYSFNHEDHGFAPSMTHSLTPHGPSHHSQNLSQHSAAQQTSSPGQLQTVARGSGRNESPSPERVIHASAMNMMPSHWSMSATEGTVSSRSPSTSSGGMYSPNMGYVGSASSGYVESFDVRSHGEFYGSSDEEYKSDGAASDGGGYYYSSDSDPEETWENDEESSDDNDYDSD